MKKFLKALITVIVIAAADFAPIYFVDFNNEQAPVEAVEVIKVDSTAIMQDTVKNVKDTVVLDTLK